MDGGGGPVIGPPANPCGVEDGGKGEQEDQSSGAEPEEGRLEEVQAADGGEDRSGVGGGGGEHGLEAEEIYTDNEGDSGWGLPGEGTEEGDYSMDDLWNQEPKEKKKQSTKGFETQKRRVGCLVRGAEGQDGGG